MTKQQKNPGRSEQLARKLRAMIVARRKPGERLDSIDVLARKYAVSAITVRTALLLLQQEGRVELRHGSGCFVTEPRPSAGPAKHIAVLINHSILRPNAPWWELRILQGLRCLFRVSAYRSRLYIGDAVTPEEGWHLSCDDFVEDVEEGRISAVAAVATLLTPELRRIVQAAGIPIVGQGQKSAGFDASVSLDLPGMVREGARLLVGRGRTRIACLAWCPAVKSPFAAGPDGGVFAETLRECGVPYHPDWVRNDLVPWLPGAGWEQFRELWSARAEKPDGLLVCDDVLFRDAALAIAELGICVPEDLMVVTDANQGFGALYPFPVETLTFDPDAIAREMADRLLRLLRGEPVSVPHIRLGFEVGHEDGIYADGPRSRHPGRASAAGRENATLTTKQEELS